MKSNSLKESHPSMQRLITIGAQASLAEAWETMRDYGVSHLVVVDSGQVLGVLATAELLGRSRLDGDHFAKDQTVSDVMVPTRAVLTDRSDLREALALMTESGTTALPLARHGSLVGLVTTTDLLRVTRHLLDRETPAEQAADRSYALLSNPLVQNLMELLGQAGI